MIIVAGLGNPGREYKQTRHNIGFEVIDKLACDYNINMNKSKFRAIVGEGIIGGEKIILVKPLTFMNLSGESIREFLSYYKLSPENLIVCCDDVNLELGSIRIRRKGSDGGQNGLKNIIYQLGADNFPRVRLGVGSKPEGWDLKDYVLSHFAKEESAEFIKGVTDAAEAVSMIVKDPYDGIKNAMNLFNRKNKSPDKSQSADIKSEV